MFLWWDFQLFGCIDQPMVPTPTLRLKMLKLNLGPLLLLHVTLFTVQIFATTGNEGRDLIIETCNQTELVDFCISSLESDPRSFSSDLHGLARITIDLSYANATDTHGYIDELLGKETDPALRRCLEGCSDVYEEGIGLLQDGLEDLIKGDYDALNQAVGAALDIAVDCDNMFYEFNASSPLKQRDEMLFNLTSVSLDVVSLLG